MHLGLLQLHAALSRVLRSSYKGIMITLMVSNGLADYPEDDRMETKQHRQGMMSEFRRTQGSTSCAAGCVILGVMSKSLSY